MSTQLRERPRMGNGGVVDLETHAYCHCNPEKTLCGLDKPLGQGRRTTQPTCAVCDDLLNTPCLICGCRLR